jgi:diguanylate cyclase (GGDEF)-like protein/PAS domain S-box-containing protein
MSRERSQRTIGQPVFEHARVVRLSGTIADVTELRRAEVQLHESQQLLRSVVDHAPTVIFLVALDGRFLLVNDRLGELYGLPRERVEGRRRDEFVPASYDEQYRAHDLLVATENRAVMFEETAGDERGERTFLSVKFPVRDADGRVYAIGGISTDITERKLAERTHAHLAAIVESSDDAIIRLSTDGRIESWNRGAERVYGYSDEEALGLPIVALAAPDDASDHERLLEQLLAGSRLEQFETRERRKDGSVIDVSLTDSPIRDADGNVVGVARIARDITERKRLEGELTFLAMHDPLTGLLNRRQLSQEVQSQCARASRYGETAALLIGDIDNFKYVNDSLGHNAGDEVIKRVAAAIRNRLRATDVLARLGGDEFGVLLPLTGIDAARMTAESLCEAVAELELLIEGNRVRTTISIGVVGIEGPNVTPEDALTAGDFTMYEAKRQGRNRVAVAQPGTEREQVAGVLALPKRLHGALREQRFELHAQPIVHLATGTVDRYELLLRMRENDELLYPDAFIHTAEHYGLIGDIDRWVVEHAFELLARSDSHRASHYMINLSGRSIGDQDLLALIERGIAEHGIDPARVTFEITETAAIADIESARAFIEGLHEAGCSAALDDFGSGFASFYYLKYLPIDYLKIDGDFVRQLPGSQSDQLLIKAIVDVARGLNKYTIASHVGSEEALTMLRDYGVDYGQGFHLGRPELPASWGAGRTMNS